MMISEECLRIQADYRCWGRSVDPEADTIDKMTKRWTNCDLQSRAWSPWSWSQLLHIGGILWSSLCTMALPHVDTATIIAQYSVKLWQLLLLVMMADACKITTKYLLLIRHISVSTMFDNILSWTLMLSSLQADYLRGASVDSRNPRSWLFLEVNSF